MIRFFKKALLVISFSFIGITVPIYAQSSVVVKRPTGDEYWYVLKQAQDAYEEGEYGKAISLAELAKANRKEMVKWESYIIDQTQKYSYVRRAGDSLTDVLDALKAQNQIQATDIIESYIETYGTSYFKNSFSNFISFINDNNDYPEADYLIGKVYRLEGEVSQSIFYMEKAYKACDKLDVKDEKYDILFDLADMAKSQLNVDSYTSYQNKKVASTYYTDYEKYLLAVMADDENFTNQSYMNALLRIVKNNTQDSVDKFFLIYRSYNDVSLKALEGLIDYYSKTSAALNNETQSKAENEKALKCAALGSIIALSKIQDILEDRITGYNYKDLSDLLKQAARYPDIVEWGNVHGIWELYYNFAYMTWTCGYERFALKLFKILSTSAPLDYWKQKSQNFLDNID